ncbi:ribosome small subunit-dependent GTPase A [Acidihalobacter prosperus]
MNQGRIVARFGAELIVRDQSSGQLCRAVSPRNLVKTGPQHLRVPVCGDLVEFKQGQDKIILTRIEPRNNCLVRPDHRGRPRASVANIDQVVIVTATRPPPDWRLIDGYLTGAADLNAQVIIVINKMDIDLDDSANNHIAQTKKLYSSLGYRVICTSCLETTGIDTLRENMSHQTNLLVGQSGVGKSSLACALDPSLPIRISQLSKLTGEGRHTTTHAHLYALPGGGDLIDSPGVKNFTPYTPDSQTLLDGFPEIARYAQNCRFHNCRHDREPGCAVKIAVKNGDICATRLSNFLSIANSAQHSIQEG